MDKLIDYEGLGTFQTNLLNDNKVSPIATWSSEKISDELSSYATTSAMTTALAGKQNILNEGSNISISNTDYISALGYKYNSLNFSFAEGRSTASGSDSHAEGKSAASGEMSHAEGASRAHSIYSHAEGLGCDANESAAHAEGYETKANGMRSHSEGEETRATGWASHAEGSGSNASGKAAHAEGYYTQTSNNYEHAEGIVNLSHKTNDNYGNAGNTLHSIGIGNPSNLARKNAEEIMQNGDMYVYGVGNYDGKHVKNEQGAPANTQTLQEVIANKQGVLIAGDNITIDGNYIDAKGYVYDSSYHSISSGFGNVATGDYSCATGQLTKAQGFNSFTEGAFTIAKNEGEYAGGISNISHKEADYNHLSSTKIAGNTQYSIGIGWNHNNTENHPKNALEVMQNGDYYLCGVGNYDGVHIKNEDPNITVQTLQEVIASLEARIASLEARIAALENPNA